MHSSENALQWRSAHTPSAKEFTMLTLRDDLPEPTPSLGTSTGPHVYVQRGDLFQLGRHRLLRGDSANPDDVARLFTGERFALFFSRPPYSEQRTYKLGSFDWLPMMCGAFDQMIIHGTPDCHILVNLGLSHKNRQVDMYWLPWLMHCAEVGWPVFGWYVWDKNGVIFRENDGRLFMSHEFIFHFNQLRNPANKWVDCISVGRTERGGLRMNDGRHRKVCSADKIGQATRVPSSVIAVKKESSNASSVQIHPAVFPVALPEFIMKTWSQPGDVCYEPFAGSGTSLIAAENLQRRCYAMEISEEYCELAIQRWQEHTGQEALRIETGQAIA